MQRVTLLCSVFSFELIYILKPSDLEEVKPKNMEDVENYGEEIDAEPEETENQNSETEEEKSEENSEPVSELEILKTKLAKARKAVAKDLSQRKEAVERGAKRRFVFSVIFFVKIKICFPTLFLKRKLSPNFKEKNGRKCRLAKSRERCCKRGGKRS